MNMMLKIMQEEKHKSVQDIVFLVDARGNAQFFIELLKEHINKFADLLNNDSVDWRSKVIGYRDFTVNELDWIEDNPFTRDVDELKSQLNNLEVKGGGKKSGSLLDALHYVAHLGETNESQTDGDPMKWRHVDHAHRIIIGFTGAGLHTETSYIEPTGSQANLSTVKNILQNGRFIVFLFAPPEPEVLELGRLNQSEIFCLDGLSDNYTEKLKEKIKGELEYALQSAVRQLGISQWTANKL